METCAKLRERGGWGEDLALERCHFPIGPRNTWSNVAYPLVGGAIALHYRTSPALAIGVALTVLGIGSALYHGFKATWANRLDWVGMYMTFAALVVHAIVPGSPSAPWIMLGLGAGVAAYWSYELNGIDLNAQMGLFLALSLLPATFGPTSHRGLAAAALGTFVIGYAVWLLDRRLHPVTGLWGHALWHILTALAIGLTFVSQIP